MVDNVRPLPWSVDIPDDAFKVPEDPNAKEGFTACDVAREKHYYLCRIVRVIYAVSRQPTYHSLTGSINKNSTISARRRQNPIRVDATCTLLYEVSVLRVSAPVPISTHIFEQVDKTTNRANFQTLSLFY
jgi:hypothetical protein